MKNKLVTLLVAFLLFSIGFQAQNSIGDNKVHKVWISKVVYSKKIKGLLYEVQDEFLKVIDNKSEEIIVYATDIDMVKIRRKGKIGNGVLIGALSGFVTGGLIGLASGDDPDKTVDYGYLFGTITHEGEKAGEKVLLYGFPLAFAGACIGALLGSKKDKILINGDINNYKMQLNKLKSYSMIKAK